VIETRLALNELHKQVYVPLNVRIHYIIYKLSKFDLPLRGLMEEGNGNVSTDYEFCP
jgi:hypothetical protein